VGSIPPAELPETPAEKTFLKATNATQSRRPDYVDWAATLSRPEIADLHFRKGTLVIAESLSHQRYKFLWDIL
jgi:hypothetical protein